MVNSYAGTQLIARTAHSRGQSATRSLPKGHTNRASDQIGAKVNKLSAASRKWRLSQSRTGTRADHHATRTSVQV
jgi:hypothetical protein